uniref:Uncharacterized protein n=1 Tax=Candidatus Kentrum eta TaxID=2126337 RepID=A0A450UGA9_9GAMM|nr:MAG: hypothetical protein BECKH772A_GA0070896_1003229 [Candidatus Kentron sp. H]VFJ92536.1 MAG: hypothetical protein BECKH772B_GA0070898_100315 [Candidatus Kentron sp. H]VFJ99419.1 MAG: hypothetical protein BECKH772C_GA0070978_1003130 [Candidatus Kentron sp. H]
MITLSLDPDIEELTLGLDRLSRKVQTAIKRAVRKLILWLRRQMLQQASRVSGVAEHINASHQDPNGVFLARASVFSKSLFFASSKRSSATGAYTSTSTAWKGRSGSARVPCLCTLQDASAGARRAPGRRSPDASTPGYQGQSRILGYVFQNDWIRTHPAGFPVITTLPERLWGRPQCPDSLSAQSPGRTPHLSRKTPSPFLFPRGQPWQVPGGDPGRQDERIRRRNRRKDGASGLWPLSDSLRIFGQYDTIPSLICAAYAWIVSLSRDSSAKRADLNASVTSRTFFSINASSSLFRILPAEINQRRDGYNEGTDKIIILGNDDTLLPVGALYYLFIRCGIGLRHFQRVDSIEPTRAKPPGETAGELRIHQEFHAARSSMRFTCASLAA